MTAPIEKVKHDGAHVEGFNFMLQVYNISKKSPDDDEAKPVPIIL